MDVSFVALLILGCFQLCSCELRIEIFKVVDEGELYLPASIGLPEGANLTLSCKLIGGKAFSNKTYHGDLRWSSNFDSRFWSADRNFMPSGNVQYSVGEVLQTAMKVFNSLSHHDQGMVYCLSDRYKIYRSLHISLSPVDRVGVSRQNRSYSCSHLMFMCASNEVCIHQHFVCDGQVDCSDGSDEMCNGDPCRGKVPCDNGRCIPSSWCCDRHQDEDCEVLVRPRCCWPLDSYDLYEHNIRMHENDVLQDDQSIRTSGVRYFLIIICIFNIFVLLALVLLFMSKVCKFRMPFTRDGACQGGARPHQSNRTCNHSECIIGREFSPTYNCAYIPGRHRDLEPPNGSGDCANEISNLLSERLGSNFGIGDQPPSYTEAVNSPGPDAPFLIEVPPPSYSTSIKLIGDGGAQRRDTEDA